MLVEEEEEEEEDVVVVVEEEEEIENKFPQWGASYTEKTKHNSKKQIQEEE